MVDGSNQTYYYATTDEKIFYAIIPENEAVQNWDWIEISNYYNSSGTAITTLNGISDIKEISPKRITYVENKPDEVSYDHFIYVAGDDNTDKGIYVGDQSQISQIFSEKVNGIYVIKSNDYKNNILWWNDYDLYLTHAARYIEDSTGKYWILPFNYLVYKQSMVTLYLHQIEFWSRTKLIKQQMESMLLLQDLGQEQLI